MRAPSQSRRDREAQGREGPQELRGEAPVLQHPQNDRADGSEAAQFAGTDKTENDRNDTIIVNEVFANRVDILVTEDRGVHTKAGILGIADRVFTLDAFLEKVTAENPSLVDYKVLAVKRTVFGATDITAEFFDSFRQDYGGAAFDKWFARKADETAYVCLRVMISSPSSISKWKEPTRTTTTSSRVSRPSVD